MLPTLCARISRHAMAIRALSTHCYASICYDTYAARRADDAERAKMPPALPMPPILPTLDEERLLLMIRVAMPRQRHTLLLPLRYARCQRADITPGVLDDGVVMRERAARARDHDDMRSSAMVSAARGAQRSLCARRRVMRVEQRCRYALARYVAPRCPSYSLPTLPPDAADTLITPISPSADSRR